MRSSSPAQLIFITSPAIMITSRCGWIALVRFAILSRDVKRPSSVVMNQFIYYYSVADSDFKWDSTINLFTGWGDKIATAEARDQTEAQREVLAPFVFSSKNTSLDRDFEKARINALNRALEGNPSSGNASAALIRAMKHLELTGARIGVDDPVIDRIIKSSNLKSTTIDG